MSHKFADRFAGVVKPRDGRAHRAAARIAARSLTMQNVVTNVGLGGPIDIKHLPRENPCAYGPQRFEAAAAVRFIGINQTTILVFNTGCAVVVGSRSPEQTVQAVHRLRFMLDHYGVRTGLTNFELDNMVHVARIDGIGSIDIASIAHAYPQNTTWDPNKFPGLRLNYKNMLIRMFDTNHVVIMGATNLNQIRQALDHVVKLCNEFNSAQIPPPSRRFAFRIERQEQNVINALPIPPNLLSVQARSCLDDL